ncbi:MAG: hypothetical protein M1816_007387 [Peltula sp. TS41687]|nr:MAG: hypothetical protein M1816_007387 [Peltula sp. TS41687]
MAGEAPTVLLDIYLGMSMFIVSNLLGSTIQITTLPLPVLSTLQASGLVFNTLCATWILGEPFTRGSFWGTLLVCVGAVLIAFFGAMDEPAHSLDELLRLLGCRPFVLWMIGQAVLVTVVLCVAKLIKVTNPKKKHTPRNRLLRGVAYGCVSGFLSAHSLLLAKSAVELLIRSIFDRNNQFNRWQSWMLVLGLITFALTQLYYLHRGLKLCSTSVLYPLVFCIYNITAILDGLIYFRQTSKLTVLRAVLISLGTFILLSGVLALSWRLDHHHEPPCSNAPIVSQNPLSPGLGLYDETRHHEAADEASEDEERPLIRPKRPSSLSRRHTAYSYFSQYSTLVEQQQQREQQEEAAEIWNELEDDHDHDPNDDEVKRDDENPTGSTAMLRAVTNRTKNRRRSSGFMGLPSRGTRRSSLLAAQAGSGPSRMWLGLGEREWGLWRMGRWWNDKERDEG